MKNNTNTIIAWIGILIIVWIIYGFLSNTKQNVFDKSNIATTTLTNVTKNLTVTDTTKSVDSLFLKQQSCSNLLGDFETRTNKEWGISVKEMNVDGWKTTLNNFIIGYSPILNACIGGYNSSSVKTFYDNSTEFNGSFEIVNISTNQKIYADFYGYSSNIDKLTVEKKYMAKLSELTNGQLK